MDLEQVLTWTFLADDGQEETVLAVGDKLSSSNSKYSVLTTLTSSSLTVTDLWLEEEGLYRCYRGNRMDQNFITHSLEIDGLIPMIETSGDLYRVKEEDTARFHATIIL